MITKGEVEHVAMLSKLNVDKSEEQDYAEYINRVISLSIEARHCLEEGKEPEKEKFISGELREDKIGVSLPQEEVLKLTAKSENGFVFLKKKV